MFLNVNTFPNEMREAAAQCAKRRFQLYVLFLCICVVPTRKWMVANYNKHLRVRIGEKPFGYIVCGKSLHGKAGLDINLRLNGIVNHENVQFRIKSVCMCVVKTFGWTVCCTTFTIEKDQRTLCAPTQEKGRPYSPNSLQLTLQWYINHTYMSL